MQSGDIAKLFDGTLVVVKKAGKQECQCIWLDMDLNFQQGAFPSKALLRATDLEKKEYPKLVRRQDDARFGATLADKLGRAGAAALVAGIVTAAAAYFKPADNAPKPGQSSSLQK